MVRLGRISWMLLLVGIAAGRSVRDLGGRWTNKPMLDDGGAYLGIKSPWRPGDADHPNSVHLGARTAHRRAMAFVYRNTRAHRAEARAG